MQQMLRRRATRSQNNDSTEEEHAEDKKFSESKTVLWRCLHAIYGVPKKLLDQDSESVQSILLNFGIVAALLLSILLSLILTVPVEETVRGDILSLSLSSPHFRCRFAPSNATAIEICSPNFTIAVFGTTNRTIICKDGPSLSKNLTTFDLFYCVSGNFGNLVRTPGNFNWLKRAPTGGNPFVPQHKEGCSSITFKEAYLVAKNVQDDDYIEYMMEESTASDTGGR